MKLTKDQFDKLYSPDISKKEYDTIIGQIDDRFAEIGTKVINQEDARSWFDYGNCNYSRDNDDSGGYFDPDEYHTDIDIGGGHCSFYAPFEDSFPTRWLWEDYEEEFASEVAKYKTELLAKKSAAKDKREALKLYKAQMRQVIESKLTKDELKYIKFK